MSSKGHTFDEIIVVVDGCIHATISGVRHDGHEGDVLFYPAGASHREAADTADPCETIFFTFLRQEEVVAGLPPLIHDRNGIIRTLASWAYRYRRVPRSRGGNLSRSFLHCIIAECVHLAEDSAQPLVEQTREYVAEHLTDSICLDDLASLAGISKYHFSRVYKRQCGRSPMEDVTHIRLEHARNLILTTNAPMAVVAAQVGLSDPYHLSHLFRSKLNIAPSALRGK